ncbi:MAG TPA: YggS family pyridoxal phosphate-dependent enzyme [Flavobacteriaceae bacterium]|nr:YggS family pyridoxal phosphate-dependent enzyme [Flavobacteriaceae bacterium]
MDIKKNLKELEQEIPEDITLVVVSKTHPVEDIMEAYNAGHRVFGENRVQEMVDKYKELPKDIEWHMVGHVQTNKVKDMAPFVSLIHGVDRMRLLREINKRAKREDRVIECLLQLKIAKEESKFGMDVETMNNLLTSEDYANMDNVKIVGLMGMATFTQSKKQINEEFKFLKKIYDTFAKTHSEFRILSMGMSGDYKIALDNGSNMLRIGSKVFGEREYQK